MHVSALLLLQDSVHGDPSSTSTRKTFVIIGLRLYQMGERSVNFLSANVDYLLSVGSLEFTARIYSLAYQIVVNRSCS